MIPSKNLNPVATIIESKLPENVKGLALRQEIVDITSRNRGKEGVTPINPGKVINHLPIPEKITINVHNTTGGSLDINVFNPNSLNAAPNGVTVTYSDGFAGKQLENLIKTLQGGLLTYGFNVKGIDAAGDPSNDVLDNALLEARYFKGYGSSYIPEEIDIAGAERNTQEKDGLLTVKTLMIISPIMQLKMTLGAGEKLKFVFSTQPMQD